MHLYNHGKQRALRTLGIKVAFTPGERFLEDVGERFSRGIVGPNTGISDSKLFEALRSQATEKNVPIYNEMTGASAVPPRVQQVGPHYNSSSHWIPDFLKKEVKNDPEFKKTFGRMFDEDWIYMPLQHKGYNLHNRADLLAHELGHKQLQEGRFTKYLQHPISGLMDKAGPVFGGLMGFYHGLQKDDEAPSEVAGAGYSMLPHAPIVGSEAGASYKGYKNLKNLGAKPEQLKATRRSLLSGLGTYAISPAASAINYGLGRGLGEAAEYFDI